MKAIFERIRALARPYLDTRMNALHAEISVRFAMALMEKEGGSEDIIIPAVLLHDVGWKRVPEELHLQAFGPKATAREWNRIHETEGAKIAKEILLQVGYDEEKAGEILKIIEGHDSRKDAMSLNDSIVKDADKLWRYSREGFFIDIERFEETLEHGLKRLGANLEKWFFTDSARQIARQELTKRRQDRGDVP